MIDFSAPLKPMLAKIADPFSGLNYSYEIKWDGFRAIAFLDPHGSMRLQSRNLKELLPRFPSLAALNTQVTKKTILDGEIVSFVEGKPNFTALSQGEGTISYLAFDLLYHAGESLLVKPLKERQERLFNLGGGLAVSRPLTTDGLSAFAKARELNLEGIMAKEKDSPYLPGVCSGAWLKFKVRKTGYIVLGGYSGERELSVLAGAWQGKKLRYLGKVAIGGKEEQKKLTALFPKLLSPHSPFSQELAGENLWLQPQLTAKIQYLELTNSGKLRQPSWQGLAYKKSEECLWEEL